MQVSCRCTKNDIEALSEYDDVFTATVICLPGSEGHAVPVLHLSLLPHDPTQPALVAKTPELIINQNSCLLRGRMHCRYLESDLERVGLDVLAINTRLKHWEHDG